MNFQLFPNPCRLQAQILTKTSDIQGLMPLLKFPRPDTMFAPRPRPRLGVTAAPPSASPPANRSKLVAIVSIPGVIYCHHHNILFGAVNLQT